MLINHMYYYHLILISLLLSEIMAANLLWTRKQLGRFFIWWRRRLFLFMSVNNNCQQNSKSVQSLTQGSTPFADKTNNLDSILWTKIALIGIHINDQQYNIGVNDFKESLQLFTLSLKVLEIYGEILNKQHGFNHIY